MLSKFLQQVLTTSVQHLKFIRFLWFSYMTAKLECTVWHW